MTNTDHTDEPGGESELERLRRLPDTAPLSDDPERLAADLLAYYNGDATAALAAVRAMFPGQA